MKLKTISFSVIKQIIAHQDCWAQSSSLSEGLLLLLGPAPRGQEGGGWSREEAQGRGGWVGGFRGRHPKEGWGRRWEEINVPLRSETALYPPQHPAPLSREKVHDQAPGPWLLGRSSHPPSCLRARRGGSTSLFRHLFMGWRDGNRKGRPREGEEPARSHSAN